MAVLSAYETEFGIVINSEGESDGENTAVVITTYAPDDPNYSWAQEQLAAFNASQ